MLSNLFRRHKLVLKVSVVCFVTTLLMTGVFLAPPSAHAKALSIQQVKEQSLLLYGRLQRERSSQSDIDAAMQSQFGLQRLNANQEARSFTSASSDVDLPTPTIYKDLHGVTFIYAFFNWNMLPVNDPMDYNDVFGIWFTQNITVGSSQLRVTELGTGDTLKIYNNATNYNQGGVDFAENANYWQSGQIEVSFNGDMPAGCTQVFSKYTHGWSSNDLTSTSVSVGLPATAGIQVTYSATAHSWQTTGSTPAEYGCPNERSDPGV